MWITIFLLCGIFNAWTAKEKNKSPITWFFMGIMFGPLSLFILGYVNREDSRKAKKRITALKMMSDADALAEMIVVETDLSVCRDAAEALVELDDERGKEYLENARNIEA